MPLDQEIQEFQKQINSDYEKLLANIYDQGMCKKIVPLENIVKDGNGNSNTLCLAMTHDCSGSNQQILLDEIEYLKYIKSLGLPVVELQSGILEIKDKDNLRSYGVLMNFLPQHNFIEAKTPATLKLFLAAALLGIHIPNKESWFREIEQINLKIMNKVANFKESDFQNFRANLENALNSFKKIINILKDNNLAIVDLQALISMQGHITIIDPLDIGNLNPEFTDFKSIRYPNRKSNIDLLTSIMKTYKWLTDGFEFCNKLKQSNSLELILEQLNLSPKGNIFKKS